MTKLSGKIKALIIIGIVTVIALVYSFVHLYNEKLYWQEQAAEYNRYHWSEIYLMAERIENLGFTKETIKEIFPYINAKIFSSITGLYPAFNGDAAYTAVLNTYYVQLAQDISYGDLSEERLVEALVLFADATDDLKELSQKVLEMTEDTKDSMALRKVGSKLYNEVEEMVKSYCNEYGKKIRQFNNGDNQQTDNTVQNDVKAFEKYFREKLSLSDVTVSAESIYYYGSSNGYRVYSVAYDGQLHSDAFCSDTVGGYTFYKSVMYMPYSIAIYAVSDGEVYTLKEAYEKGKINIEEVYSFMPQSVKSPS